MKPTHTLVRPLARRATSVAGLVACAVLVTAALGGPADAVGSGSATKGTTSAQQWTGKGACSGGPGNITFTVLVPVSGQISLSASVTGLHNGATWKTAFVEDNDAGTQTQVSKGTAVVAKHILTYDATLDPISDPYWQFTAFGPHKRICSILIRPAKPLAVAGGCHQATDRSIAFTAVKRPDHILRFRAMLAPARPGSRWSVSVTQTTGGSGAGVGQSVTATRKGGVRFNTNLSSRPWDSVSVSFTGPGGAACRASIATAPVA